MINEKISVLTTIGDIVFADSIAIQNQSNIIYIENESSKIGTGNNIFKSNYVTDGRRKYIVTLHSTLNEILNNGRTDVLGTCNIICDEYTNVCGFNAQQIANQREGFVINPLSYKWFDRINQYIYIDPAKLQLIGFLISSNVNLNSNVEYFTYSGLTPPQSKHIFELLSILQIPFKRYEQDSVLIKASKVFDLLHEFDIHLYNIDKEAFISILIGVSINLKYIEKANYSNIDDDILKTYYSSHLRNVYGVTHGLYSKYITWFRHMMTKYANKHSHIHETEVFACPTIENSFDPGYGLDQHHPYEVNHVLYNNFPVDLYDTFLSSLNAYELDAEMRSPVKYVRILTAKELPYDLEYDPTKLWFQNMLDLYSHKEILVNGLLPIENIKKGD